MMVPIHALQWYRFADTVITTGSTFANKIQTMQAIQEKGYKPKDDNESDSISIMLCYCYYQNIRVNHPDN